MWVKGRATKTEYRKPTYGRTPWMVPKQKIKDVPANMLPYHYLNQLTPEEQKIVLG